MAKVWILFSVCLLGFGLVACAPLLHKSPATSAFAIKRQDPQGCRIPGNSDFYGLGIRIGIYLQWITAFLANHFLKKSIEGSLKTNTIFLLALFIATVVATTQDAVESAEIVVLLQLCFGFLFSILSIWGYRTRSRQSETSIRFPLVGSFFRLTLATAISAYGVWFWFSGAPLLHQHSSCSDHTFLFARLDIASGVRIFFQIQSTLILIVYGILFARELITIVCFFCLVVGWTAVLAGLTVIFGQKTTLPVRDEQEPCDPEKAEKLHNRAVAKNFVKNLFLFFRQWLRLSIAVVWKRANGKESSGSNRPNIENYLVPFIDFRIFSLRTTFQFLCLVTFKTYPPVGYPSIIRHPILGKRNPDTRWDKFKRQVQDWFNTRYTQQAIYTSNVICIVWTILSVELTLVWNNISGVYIISSTGQLIPFIVGIVGLAQLLHGISVQRSAIQSTEVLMELLDVKPSDVENENLESATRPSPNKYDDFDGPFPLRDGDDTVFWKRNPARRHSIDIIRPEHIREDTEDLSNNDETIRGGDFHLEHRFDYSTLEHVYGALGVETYPLKEGQAFWIVKDFRRHGKRRICQDEASNSSKAYIKNRGRSTARITPG